MKTKEQEIVSALVADTKTEEKPNIDRPRRRRLGRRFGAINYMSANTSALSMRVKI